MKTPSPSPHPGQWTVVDITSGVGETPIGANATMGALRSWLAIGEVQVLLNPCTGSGDLVPTHLSVGGERGVSPGSPGQWTVVGIASGGGDRGGGSPPSPQAVEPVGPSS